MALTPNFFSYGIPAMFTFILGLMLLYLRIKAESLPTTQVQRWGMVLLAWLFLCNGVLNLVGISREIDDSIMLHFLSYDLPVIAPLFLLGFSLVFPRSVVRPSRIPLLFLFLSFIFVFVWISEVGGNQTFNIGWPYFQDMWIYTGWFGSLFRWVQIYRRNEAHPEVSLISTILIWAVLYHVLLNIFLRDLSGVPMANVPSFLVFHLSLLQFLTVIVLILIGHQLYERRGRWQGAEKLHLIMLGLAIGLLLLSNAFSATRIPYLGWIFYYMVADGGIMLVRPILICYAILGYQFFGQELRAERIILFIATPMTAYFLALFLSFGLVDVTYSSEGMVVIGAFFVLLLPSYWLAKRLVSRAIPDTRRLSRKQARDLYFISLHGALFKGRIEDRRDRDALVRLRKRLKISEREHELLMESERVKERTGVPVTQIGHVIFVKDTGLHVASVRAIGDQDETIIAGMLTAVRMFVKDAFGSSTGDLDTIQYGDRKLLMEWERGYIIAVDMAGEIDPASKAIVGDMMAIIMRRHWKVLREWEGDLSEVKQIQDDLETIVHKYNKTGTF